MTQQQFANYVQTTLASGCTNVATTLTLTSVSGLPTVGNFRLRIDDVAPATTFEYVEVTSVNVGASQVTATRGMEGTTGIAHSAGAIVGNDLTAAMLLAAFPLGILPGGYGEAVVAQSGITTITDLTSLTASVTVGAGRRIRVTGRIAFSQTVATDLTALAIREGAATLTDAELSPGFTGGDFPLEVAVVLQPSTGAHTYKLSLTRAAGTGTVGTAATATRPCFILIEDIGSN